MTARIDHPDLDVRNIRVPVPGAGIGHLALPVHPAVAAGIRQGLGPDAAAADSGAISVA